MALVAERTHVGRSGPSSSGYMRTGGPLSGPVSVWLVAFGDVCWIGKGHVSDVCDP